MENLLIYSCHKANIVSSINIVKVYSVRNLSIRDFRVFSINFKKEQQDLDMSMEVINTSFSMAKRTNRKYSLISLRKQELKLTLRIQ